jgi:ParB family transcriptional regulator, chromosome partitioning protein
LLYLCGMTTDTIKLLAIDVLEPNPFQPRERIKDEDVQELSHSIKKFGILEPLLVAQTPAGYQLIAGERRWRAAKLAGLKEVPTIIKKTTPKGMLEMALIENVQRTNLNAIERAQAFQQLMRDFGLGVSDIADRVSKSGSYISNSLKLLQLPDAIKDGILGKVISEGHARAIAGIEDLKSMVEVYKIILKENASVRRAEELARLAKANNHQIKFNATPARRKVFQVNDEQVKAWEESFQKFLKAQSKIKLTRTNQQTRITITLKGDPITTQKDLEKLMKLADANKLA